MSETAADSPDVIDLQVLCLNGEGCTLKVRGSSLGWEVCQMISRKLPPKKGGKLTLQNHDAQLFFDQTLRQQGILGKAATLSCTYVPTNLYVAWHSTQEDISEVDFSIEGVTRIEGITVSCLHLLPRSIETLSFGHRFNLRLAETSLPNSLRSLTVDDAFDQSLEQVKLPHSLQSLKFGHWFNQSMQRVTLPSSLESLTFGHSFNQSMERVTLPSSLESLTFGHSFNQSMEEVPLPNNLQTLTFDHNFNWSLEQLMLPSSLKVLEFGAYFNQSLKRMTLPDNLRSLTFGHDFNQNMAWVSLPSSLQHFWLNVQPKPRSSGPAKQSSDTRIWPKFYPEP
jgi:hypothetical protein